MDSHKVEVAHGPKGLENCNMPRNKLEEMVPAEVGTKESLLNRDADTTCC